MTLDHPMDEGEGRCIHFLPIVLDIGNQEARSLTVRGLHLEHKVMQVDLSESRNKLSLYVRRQVTRTCQSCCFDQWIRDHVPVKDTKINGGTWADCELRSSSGIGGRGI